MNFKIDENLPRELAHLLAAAGHDALTVNDQQLGGQPDRRIIEVCKAEERALITADKDFSDIRAYPPCDFHGIVVLRLNRRDKPSILEIFQSLIPSFEMETLDSRLWIVEDDQIRIRR